MQRLRSTFKRSRTPTGAEMKSQSSLEVPKQVRSVSFDEIQLGVKLHDCDRTSKINDVMRRTNTNNTASSSSSSSSPARSEAKRSITLRVPHLQGTQQRSRSFDNYERTSLFSMSPKSSSSSGSRKGDGLTISPISTCYHCQCVHEYKKLFMPKTDDSSDNDVTYDGGNYNNGDDMIDNEDENVKDNDEDFDYDAVVDDSADEDDDEDVVNSGDDNAVDDVENYDYDGVVDDGDVDGADIGDNTNDEKNNFDDSSHCKREKQVAIDSEEPEHHVRDSSPEIRVTLMIFEKCSSHETRSLTHDDEDVIKVDIIPQDRPRRLSRQEALTSFPIDLPSISGPSDDDDVETRPDYGADSDIDDNGDDNADGVKTNNDGDDDDNDGNISSVDGEYFRINEHRDNCQDDKTLDKSKFVVRDIFLAVPELKRDRAASVDSCFNNSKNEKDEGSDYCLAVPQSSTRSRSVDIVLPTDCQTRYTALLPNRKTNRNRGGRGDTDSNRNREPRSTPDWGVDSINGEHLWVPTAASGDFCYANDCSKHGPRLKCAACRVMAHASCTSNLNFDCKPNFRDVGVRQYREQTSTHHHWVHRRSEKGKCANCSKAFQSKLSFSSKEIVAVSCSWCKSAYHNRETCFNVQKLGENCELGVHKSIIVPPSWIVKLPRKGSFKSSLRKSPRKKKSGSVSGGTATSTRRKSRDKEKDEKDHGKLWVVKPIPTPNVRPVVVFINPKSGGNQGAKLLQKFQWLLNPRQVFDLTQGGPKMGLELFKKVPNLRVLACGGDGTVGWVLSILDQIGASPPPAVGVLPLGTGNDLARALGWGGGYTDEPIGKILSNIGDSDTTLLDRWQVTVEKNTEANNDDDSGKGKENLPLNVVNNYFSLGVDAHIALEFHEAREAHPEKFNSRLRNKMFYGQMGGKDLVRRKWKDLSEFVTLECDGNDMTPKLKEHRVHAIVFLNIPSYGGGTHPWGVSSGTKEPSTEDGLFEVVGLTTYQLPLLQAGGHGTCITQCSHAKLVTTRTIPMQVDGEACRVLPSIIEMKLLNKATMLTKRRRTNKSQSNIDTKLESLKLPLMKIRMTDYESYHSDKDRLKKTAVLCRHELLELDATMDLESLRKMLAKDFSMDACCFLDSCTAERFFRIDRAQEQLHYVTDVASEAVYILEEDASSQNVEGDVANVAEPETAQVSPCSRERAVITGTTTDVGGGRKSKFQPAENIEPSREMPNSKNKSDSGNNIDKSSLQIEGSSKQISVAGRSAANPTPTFISPRDRLFSLSSDVHSFSSGLLEKPCDGIIRAAKIGDLKSLKDLHEHGFSLLSIDASGQTALHHAARHGHKDIIRYLIACAPSTILNIVDNDKGQTALHKAAQQKRRSICFMLVAGGATLTVADRHGNTPRHLALNAEDRELAAYLASQEQFQLMTEGMQNL